MSDLLAKSMRLAPIGFALGCLAALAVFGLAEVIAHSGLSPFEPSPAAATAISHSPPVADGAGRGQAG